MGKEELNPDLAFDLTVAMELLHRRRQIERWIPVETPSDLAAHVFQIVKPSIPLPFPLDTSKEPLSFEVFCIHMNWFSRWFFPTVVDHYKSVYWEQRWILKFREENPELNGELRKYFQMRHEGESISPEIKKKLYDAYLIIIWYDEVDSGWNMLW